MNYFSAKCCVLRAAVTGTGRNRDQQRRSRLALEIHKLNTAKKNLLIMRWGGWKRHGEICVERMSSKDRAAGPQGDELGPKSLFAEPDWSHPAGPCPLLALPQGDECQEFRKQLGLGRLMDRVMLTVSDVHSLAKHPSGPRMRNSQRLGNSPQSFERRKRRFRLWETWLIK